LVEMEKRQKDLNLHILVISNIKSDKLNIMCEIDNKGG